MSVSVVDINLENAQSMLIEESFKRPVVVDFWADWCEPCKTLMPILESLAAEYAGAFLLAKVNADELQMIAQQFGVRSLPTVMVLKEGQPVDGFAGAQPEVAIRELLNKYLPKPWDEAQQRAHALMAEQQWSEALALLRTAYQESGERADIGKDCARCLLELNRAEEAQTLLANIKMVDQDGYYQQLMAQLELKLQAAKSPEIETLEKALHDNPDDLDAAWQLAVQLSQESYHRDALELLYSILQRDRDYGDGGVKRAYLDIIKTLGNADPIAIEFQKRLFRMMY